MLRGADKLGKTDDRLKTVLNIVGSTHEIEVMQADRSVEDEQHAIDTGHSTLKDPWHSKHVIGPKRPLALAVDVAPYPVDWKDIPGFRALDTVMQTTASEIGVALRWGGDWGDYDHWEIADAD